MRIVFQAQFFLLMLFSILTRESVSAQIINLSESVDWASFKADSGYVQIEFYIALQKSKLPYLRESNHIQKLELDISLKAKTIGGFEKLSTVKLISRDSISKEQDGLLMVNLEQVLPPNTYDFEIKATGSDGRRFQAEGEFKRLRLKSYDSDSLRASDIQLAVQAVKSDRVEASFYKNGLEVIPNPTAIYGNTLPLMVIYIELYNLVRNLRLNSDSLYTRTYLSRGELIIEETERRKVRRRTSDAIVYIEKTMVDSLLSGKYDYHFELCDSSFLPKLHRTKSIYIYNPSIKPQMLAGRNDELSAEFNGASEELLQEMREQIEYVITTDEKDAFKSAQTLDQRRQFFEQFWIKRGGTSIRRAYMNKVEEANRRFSQGSLKGFKSDKGRIFIKHGEPHNIERENASNNQKPYEIWQYENISGQGSVIFVFADRMGFGRYELIHSTAIGEVFNQNWQQIVNQVNTRGNANGF